jgi:hypothetical protein
VGEVSDGGIEFGLACSAVDHHSSPTRSERLKHLRLEVLHKLPDLDGFLEPLDVTPIVDCEV